MSISDSQQNSPDLPSCQSTKQSGSTFPSSRHIFPTINRNSMSISDCQKKQFGSTSPSSRHIFPTIKRNSMSISDSQQNSLDLPPHLLDISSLQSTKTQCQFRTVTKTVRIYLPIFPTYLPYNQQKLIVNFCQSTKQSRSTFLPVDKTVRIHLPIFSHIFPTINRNSMSISDSQQHSPDPPSCQSTKQSRSTFLSSRHIFPTINRNSLFISDNNQISPDPPPHLLDISSLQSTETQCQFLPVNKTVQIHLPIFSTYLPTINRNSLFISDNNQNSPDLPPHLLDIFPTINRNSMSISASQQNSPDPPSCQSTKQSRHIFPSRQSNQKFIVHF